MHIVWGLALAVSSGVAFGIFLAPLRIIKPWQWENVWTIWAIFGNLIGPVLFAVWTIPQYFELNRFIGVPILLITIVVGTLAGTSGFLYGVTVPSIGLGLATALNSGASMAMSLVPLLALHRGSIAHPAGLLAITGVALSVSGVTLCGKGGSLREGERENGKDPNGSVVELRGVSQRMSFVKAVMFCCLAGTITSAFNLALAFPNPVINAALRFGTTQFNAANTFTAPWLIGACITNLAYAAFRLEKNKTLRNFTAPGWLACVFWSLLLTMGYLCGIYSYTASVSLLGTFGGVITWGVSMAAMILTSALWDLSRGEWNGTSARVMMYGIQLLMAAIVALSFAQYFVQREGL